MSKLRDSVRLTLEHPERLDEYARRPTRGADKRTRAKRVDTSKSVHPLVWRQAMALAGGDARRIQVVSPTDVRVH